MIVVFFFDASTCNKILFFFSLNYFPTATNWGLLKKENGTYNSPQVNAVRAFNQRKRYSMFSFVELMTIIFGPTWSADHRYQSSAGPRTDPPLGTEGRAGRVESLYVMPGAMNGYMPNEENNYDHKFINMSLSEMEGKFFCLDTWWRRMLRF